MHGVDVNLDLVSRQHAGSEQTAGSPSASVAEGRVTSPPSLR
jgi:hypothetical protein